MKITVLLIVLFSLAKSMAAGKTITYKEGNTELEGYISETANKVKKTPGFIIVHDWMGLSEDNKQEADKLADKGFVAIAADIYGKGVRPKTPEEAGKTAGQYKTDRALLKKRIQAAYEVLVKNPKVDAKKIIVFGYCFGGMTALELGRNGTELAGIVTFHGNLDSPHPEEVKNIKGKVLILHGAIDPYVPATQMQEFQTAMDAAGKDYQIVKYSGAVHAFTNKKAGDDIKKGAAYNAVADQRARKHFDLFVEEILANK